MTYLDRGKFGKMGGEGLEGRKEGRKERRKERRKGRRKKGKAYLNLGREIQRGYIK